MFFFCALFFTLFAILYYDVILGEKLKTAKENFAHAKAVVDVYLYCQEHDILVQNIDSELKLSDWTKEELDAILLLLKKKDIRRSFRTVMVHGKKLAPVYKYWRTKYPDTIEKYKGKFVAVHPDFGVIFSNDDLYKLAEEIKSKNFYEQVGFDFVE